MKIKTTLFKSTFPKEQSGVENGFAASAKNLQGQSNCGPVPSGTDCTEPPAFPAEEVWCRIRASQSLGGSSRWSWRFSRGWEGGEGAVTGGRVHRKVGGGWGASSWESGLYKATAAVAGPY